jgi:hypothetical protein
MIISPCVSICKTDPVTGYCYGCARTNEEKKIWEDEKTTEEWKKNNLEEITKRMSGWQLSSFKESYEHKIKSGVSLLQKHSIQEKP